MTPNTYIQENTSYHKNAIQAVVTLLDGGATIPFIARYRKDQTGNLDEIAILEIQKLKEKHEKLVDRKESILKKLQEIGVEENILSKVKTCWDLSELERIYEPFKVAKGKILEKAITAGFEKFAKMLMSNNSIEPSSFFASKTCKDFPDADAVEKGIAQIVQHFVYQNSLDFVHQNALRNGSWQSKLKKTADEEKVKHFSAYTDFSQRINRIASHQFLALERAKEEKVLSVKLDYDKAYLLEKINERYLKSHLEQADWLEKEIKTCFQKKLSPKIERELWKYSKEQADEQAVKVFSRNLKQLLLTPPLGEARVLGIDPGFRSGCKLVCIDRNGDLLHNETIFPFSDEINKRKMAGKKLRHATEVFKIEAIAVGDGTAGKETLDFAQKQLLYNKIPIIEVNESGASVYSASSVGREEFPSYDVTVRGAVSIARRLVDPLAELIKIDPKSIGVGQYQHSVNQKLLEEELGFCVEFCVNEVGVNLNTASKYLLKRIAGLNENLAQKIVEKRSELGAFESRKQLLEVKGLGTKAFEQSAAFMKIFDGENPLDATGIHPENYQAIYQLTRSEDIKEIREKIGEISDQEAEENGIGKHTFTDIKNAILKPQRDPRPKLKDTGIDNGFKSINDVFEGQMIQGKVKNITNFGCFLDIGIKENALLHISKIKAAFVSDVHEHVSLNEILEVKVIQVDKEQKRIGVSLID
ncbi:MAG: helix-hairpin-helix domain-containing protein [Flavobacteriales bacterium]|jgi:uncharacterized protein|nr:helix-hairpin-helix domain-containing protein [Flavobacteriales bacterium]